MNRTIKFRCWNTAAKAMYPNEHFGLTMDGDTLQLMRDCEHHQNPYRINNTGSMIFMQFTGLLDKNGKEIYEGDILRINPELLEEVKWVDESSWMADKCPVNGFVNHESIYKRKPEIIGNIYENPELLTTKE